MRRQYHGHGPATTDNAVAKLKAHTLAVAEATSHALAIMAATTAAEAEPHVRALQKLRPYDLTKPDDQFDLADHVFSDVFLEFPWIIAVDQMVGAEPEPEGEEMSDEEPEPEPNPIAIAIGDFVQWRSGGIDQFKSPRRVTSLDLSAGYAFVQGSKTGLPIGDLTVIPQLVPDKEQLARFVAAIFKHANPAGFVSLRSFRDGATNRDKPIFIEPITLGDPQFHEVAVERAWQAAAWEVPAVFCPPLVTFHTGKDAKTENVSEGVAISVECDERPVVTQQILQGLLGDPTIIVASGGEWIDNETGEVEPKVHMHWRLTTPVSSPAQQARLREARDLAAKLVGSDYTAVPLVHPLRWPGSWHRKQTPRLAKIVFESENEVDLDEALERLRDVTGAWSISEQFRHDFSASHQTNPKLLAEKVEYVASALRVIPNNNLKWCDWNYVGLAIWGATGGSAEGFKAFADWSAKAPKNIVANTEERWAHFAKSPPDRIGFGTLVYLARQSDPSWDFEGSTSVAEPADPIDLWAKFEPPTLPRGVLPNIIERFAFDQGVDMGADMAGIAVSALAVCAAAIPDKVQLQVKRHHNGWLESARLWVALVGPPSTMKSPIMAAAVRPLRQIDAALARDYAEQRAEYDKLGKEEKAKNTPPKQTRLLLQDTTIEAAQEILKDSPDGMLCYQDEMSGWFGSMDKYSGGRGAAKDRAFWLESYNGSPYSVNRIGRGAAYIDNLSISLIGGIQSEPIRKLAEDSVDDGLLQRLLPIVLAPAVIGRDEEMSTVVSEYGLLIERLHSISAKILKLDEGGQCYRQELERRHLDLQSCEAINPKLAAHIGKYNGLFARLCVIWHCVEAARRVSALDLNSPDPATIIPEATARRVGAFLHGFLLPHAIAFYAGMLGLSNDHERLTAVAGYILAHKLERLSNRDIQRGDRTMRKLGRQEIDVIFDHLDALGWIDRIPGRRIGAHHWAVNPVVHTKFAKRAAAEAERRAREREIITGLMGMKNEAD